MTTGEQDIKIIDAKMFQEPLGRLTETIAQKVRREGPQCFDAPGYVSDDLFMRICCKWGGGKGRE
jgi:hypothetical protein